YAFEQGYLELTDEACVLRARRQVPSGKPGDFLIAHERALHECRLQWSFREEMRSKILMNLQESQECLRGHLRLRIEEEHPDPRQQSRQGLAVERVIRPCVQREKDS